MGIVSVFSSAKGPNQGCHPVSTIPADWDGFTVEKQFRGKTLHIRVENPEHRQSGCARLTLNGAELADNCLPFHLLEAENEVVLTL